jgi:hypothetical protein
LIASDISLDSVPAKAQPKNKRDAGRGVRAFNQEVAMSKAQKGNKENKKPKADKNRVKGVSAYKSAQSQGKPASSRFGKKTWRKGSEQAANWRDEHWAAR